MEEEQPTECPARARGCPLAQGSPALVACQVIGWGMGSLGSLDHGVWGSLGGLGYGVLLEVWGIMGFSWRFGPRGMGSLGSFGHRVWLLLKVWTTGYGFLEV